jgi:predicted ATP-grasp superfamily ATP-dependent carboligase
MPRDLVNAGWSVSLLAPKGSLAEHSRYVATVGHLPDNATPLQWVHSFAAMAKATAPRMVLPCDDTAFRLMQQLVVAPPNNMRPELQLQLASLITESLGDFAHYRTSVDKTLVCPAAEAAGVRVPPYRVISDSAEATSFAATHGWPVVLKRSHSSAGDGVAICADQEALIRQFARLLNNKTLSLNDSDANRLLVQAYIPGRTQYFAGTAWRGSLLCGYAVDRLAGEPQGPASVVRYFHSAELQVSATKLAAGFGATGIFAPEYIIHERTGEPYLIEVNRRLTPGTHRGQFINVSTGSALLAAMQGRPLNTRTRLEDGEEHVFVSFPHEWLRDPSSRYLRDYPVDVPWDEPELIEAMLAMRNDR